MRKVILMTISLILSLTMNATEPVGEGTIENMPETSELEALFNVSGQQIVETASRYLGRPYRSGSKGPSAFDCSGFTSYVYKSLNIRLNSSSRSQFDEGVSVDKDDLQKGDLVFFSGSSRGGIGHVGIVYEVNDDGSFDFIHASSSRGVTVSNSNEGYYNRRYKGARRIIEDENYLAFASQE